MKKITLLFLPLLICTFVLNAQQVDVVVTDGDGNERLANWNSFNLNQFTISNPSISINENDERQEIDGFGYMLTQGSAKAILSLSPEKQDELINEYFNPNSGQKTSIVRISIGASDLSESVYTYNENANDFDQSEFSLEGPDSRTLIPILKKIIAINPDIKILATPWTAPRWMKTNNWWIGGRLRQDRMAVYALYFRKYLEAMNAKGLKIWGITVQNEPENDHNEPSMAMNASEQLDFINNHLRGQIENLTFGTPKVIGFDHNCDNVDFPSEVANGSSFVDGSAFHLYEGDISALTTVRNRTNKNIYFTEQFTSSEGDFNEDLGWHMEEVVIGSIRNWSKTVIEWNLANFADFTPRTPGGCTTCLGASTIENNGYSRNVSYYIIGQVARFVDPGAKVLASTNGMTNAAFKNPDGSYVLLVFNKNDFTRNISVNISGKSFSYDVPGRVTATFKWRESAPNSPNGLIATDGFGEIGLKWNASSGAETYDVFRSTSSNSGFSRIATDLIDAKYTDDNVNIGTRYYYKVVAKNNVGNSGDSNTDSAIPQEFTQIIPDGDYMIYFNKNDEAVIAPSSNVSLATVDIEDNNQYWNFEHIESNIYKIKNFSTGKYIGVKDNWCGVFGDLRTDYKESDDNILFKIIAGEKAYRYSFQLAFTNCGFESLNDPVKGWDVDGGAVGADLHTFESDNGSDNQQFELRARSVLTETLKKNDAIDLFKIYPSPVTEIITIDVLNSSKENSFVELKDLTGKTLLSHTLSGKVDGLNVSNLSDGVYTLYFYDKSGKFTATEKIVVMNK